MNLIRNFLGALALIGLGLPAFATQQPVNVGKAANDGTGDPARLAFQKLNSNDADLYSFLYAPITGPVTIASGTNTSAIGSNVLTNGMFSFMPAQTTKCNFTVVAAAPMDCTVTQMAAMLGITGGGPIGTLTNFSLAMPSIFSVTGTPLTVDGSTISVSFAGGLPANQFLATPCGAAGTIGLRTLCAGDLPNFTGQVSASAGVTTINPGVVTNAMLATSPASTIKCNPTAGAASDTDCTAAQITQIIGTGGGSGGSGLTNQVDACTLPGIDPTGSADSRTGVFNAFAMVAGTNKELEINCPIKIVIGVDPTKPIFVHDGTNLRFGPNGMFIVDNVMIPAFVFLGTQNCIWVNAQFEYLGAAPLNDAVAPYANVANNFNDVQMKGYMAAYLGNTFAGGSSSLWSGPNNGMAILDISGTAAHLTFERARFFVPPGTPATNFIPTAVALNTNWLPGLAQTGAVLPVNSTYAALPTDIKFDHAIIDGFYMGFVGGCQCTWDSPIFLRYSDLQDASGGTQGGVGNWTSPPHAIYVANLDASFNAHNVVLNAIDYGIYVGGPVRRSTGSGSICSLKLDISNGTVVDGYVSYRPDGVMDLIQNGPENQGGTVKNVTGYFNSATATANGGILWGLRWPTGANPYRNIVIQNFTIYDSNPAPMAFPVSGTQVSGNQDISIQGLKVFMNDVAASFYTGFGMAGTNINVEAEYHFAQMSTTGTFIGPIANQGSETCVNCSYDVKLFGWRQVPVTFSAPLQNSINFTAALSRGAVTATLSAAWAGVSGSFNVTFSDGEVRLVAFTNGSASLGTFSALSNAVTASAIAAGSTTGTLAASWIYPTGTYSITFGDNESRYVSFTNGSAALGTWAPLMNTQTAAGATAGNLMAGNNFAAYKPRMLADFNGGSINTRAHILDVSNQYEVTAENGVETETFAQMYMGTPTGASQATNIVYPNGFTIDRSGEAVYTALTGITGFNVGWTGNLTALSSNHTPSGSNQFTAPSSISVPNSPTTIVLTPIGGNFSGVGFVVVSTRATQVSIAQ